MQRQSAEHRHPAAVGPCTCSGRATKWKLQAPLYKPKIREALSFDEFNPTRQSRPFTCASPTLHQHVLRICGPARSKGTASPMRNTPIKLQVLQVRVAPFEVLLHV